MLGYSTSAIITIIFCNLPFLDSVLLSPTVLSSLSVRLMPFLKNNWNKLVKGNLLYFVTTDATMEQSQLKRA
jgi:hypothetical protein